MHYLIKEVADYINNPPPGFVSCVVAMLISCVRVLGENRETSKTRVLLESIICGAITYSVYKAITAMGLNPDWAVCAGGVIGLLGSEYIKSLAKKTINHKVEDL